MSNFEAEMSDTLPALICAKRLQELIKDYIGEAPGYATLARLISRHGLPIRRNPLSTTERKHQSLRAIRFSWPEVKEWIDLRSKGTTK